MIFILLSLATFAVAQPRAPPGSGSEDKCVLQGNLAILLDPAVDGDTFEVLKRSALNAALTLDLSSSRIGIWQATHPPQLELEVGPTTQGDLIEKFMKIEHDYSQSHDATETLREAAKWLQEHTDNSNDRLEFGKENAILYVAGSPIDEALLQAAEDVREQGVSIWVIAGDVDGEDLEDLFALAGGLERVYPIPPGSASGATTRALQEWFCGVAEDGFGANADYIGINKLLTKVIRDGLRYEGSGRRRCFVDEFGDLVCDLKGCLVNAFGGRICGSSVFTGSDPIVIVD